MLKPKKDAFCSETNFSISSKRVSSLSPWLSFHSDYNKNVQWILNILLIHVQVSLLNSHSAYTFLHFIVECTKLHAEIIRNVIMIFLGIYKKEHPPPHHKKRKTLDDFNNDVYFTLWSYFSNTWLVCSCAQFSIYVTIVKIRISLHLKKNLFRNVFFFYNLWTKVYRK